MNSNFYKAYNGIRNALYKVKPILKIYSIFSTDIPDKLAAIRLNKKGYTDLNQLFDVIRDSNIICFCDFGTLLGFIREESFIPHDNDIDLGIIADKDFSWAELEGLLQLRGLRLLHYYSYDGVITEQTYTFKDGITVDFFLYQYVQEKEMRTFVYYKNHDLLYSNKHERSVKALVYPAFYEVKWTEIHGARVCIPKDPEKRLEAIYGSGWKTPDPNYKPDRKINIMDGLGEKHDA